MLTRIEETELLKMAEEQSLTLGDYATKLASLKHIWNITWDDIAYLVNTYFKTNYSESYYRKRYGDFVTDIPNISKPIETTEEDEAFAKIVELNKLKAKISDERTQARAYVRRIAREDTIKEIAHDFAVQMSNKKLLERSLPTVKNNSNEAILQISDWHYGLVCDNFWNKYDPEIAKTRLAKLLGKTIEHCKKNNVSTLYVVNLADLIAGRIHLTLRLESRFDVITQIMEVSEMLAEFLTELSSHFKVHYYSCLDNHSRLEPNKLDSLDLESLCRITDWYLKERVGKYIEVHDNMYGEDIVTFNVKNYSILGVHGDKDKPTQIIDSLSRMTESHYDLILTAHLHHFSCDEKNRTVIISNSSLMGTDTFAKNLRLSAKPSQNLIIVTDESVCEAIYRILV